MGFPGAIDVTCTYRMKIPGTLSVELSATSDEPTLCNLAHHSYFNLDDGGSGDILDHRLMLAAQAYLPVDEELIPTGVVKPVDGTAFDFRQARPIRHGAGRRTGRSTTTISASLPRADRCVRRPGRKGRHPAWRWRSGRPNRACSFMLAQKVERTVPGHGGRKYKAYAGFCLEPQIWPDSPNRPYFPQAVLWPGGVYRQVTEYRFSKRLARKRRAAFRTAPARRAPEPRQLQRRVRAAWLRREVPPAARRGSCR